VKLLRATRLIQRGQNGAKEGRALTGAAAGQPMALICGICFSHAIEVARPSSLAKTGLPSITPR
jgi:hypothetical protein